MVIKLTYERQHPCAYDTVRRLILYEKNKSKKVECLKRFWGHQLKSPKWQDMLKAAKDADYELLKTFVTREDIPGKQY